MTGDEIIALLNAIHQGTAFSADVEDALEDLGLIIQDDQPYAHLTKAGLALIQR